MQSERLTHTRIPPDRPAYQFNRSSFCDSSACIEVAFDTELDLVRVRNSTTGGIQRFSRSEWTAFLRGILARQPELLGPWHDA